MATKARMMETFTSIARALFRTLDSMATPCSVKAVGVDRRRPPQLEVTDCDFKKSASSAVSQNMKSSGKCLSFLLILIAMGFIMHRYSHTDFRDGILIVRTAQLPRPLLRVNPEPPVAAAVFRAGMLSLDQLSHHSPSRSPFSICSTVGRLSFSSLGSDLTIRVSQCATPTGFFKSRSAYSTTIRFFLRQSRRPIVGLSS